MGWVTRPLIRASAALQGGRAGGGVEQWRTGQVVDIMRDIHGCMYELDCVCNVSSTKMSTVGRGKRVGTRCGRNYVISLAELPGKVGEQVDKGGKKVRKASPLSEMSTHTDENSTGHITYMRPISTIFP